jgi:ABC-2 type transport system permease protein
VAWGLGILPIPLAIVLTLLSTAIAVAFTVLVGSLAFFMGNAETAAMRARDSLILFSLQPGSIFQGWAKLLLLTVIPAGFMAHIPVELLREFDPLKMGLLLAFTVALWVAVIALFHLGLRRYESGNLIGLRG